MEKKLGRDSSREDKRGAADATLGNLSDYLFDQINLLTVAFSEVTSGGYTGTSTFRGWSRLPNTAGGKFLSLDLPSRVRCQFYLQNPTKMEGYLLSMTGYDSDTSLNSFSSLDILMSYAGLKFDRGNLSFVVKQAGKSQEEYPMSLRLTDALTETYRFEMKFTAKTVAAYLDDEEIGVYPADLSGDMPAPKSVLPLLSPAKSTDGTAVNIAIENYQFVQDK